MDALHERYQNGWRKSLTATTQESCQQYWTSRGASTPQSSSCTATYHSSRKLAKLDEPYMRYTAGEVEISSWVKYSCWLLHIDEQRQDDQLETAYNTSVPIQDVTLKTCRKQWTIEKDGKRGSGRSVLMARRNDDDDDDDDDSTNSYHICVILFDLLTGPADYYKFYLFTQPLSTRNMRE